MKKNRFLQSVLSCLLCVLMVASCSGGGASTTGTTTLTTTTPPPVDDPTLHMLVEDGKSNYKIVVSASAEEYELSAAYDIRFAIKCLTNVELEIVDDTTPIGQTEIIIGSNSARLTQYPPIAEEYKQGYSIFSSGKHLVLLGASSFCLDHAVKLFVKECFGYDIDGEEISFADPVATLTVPTAYTYQRSIYDLFGDVPLYSILYDGSYMQKRMAYLWRDAILSIGNDEIEVPEPQITYSTGNLTGLAIKLCPDDAIELGKWRIDVLENKTIEVHANGYYGFVSASKSFVPFLKEHLKYYPSKSMEGDYRDSLSAYQGAAAYAYDQRTEYRAMFYNVLWDAFDVKGRDQMVAEMVRQYAPDILGLQEVNRYRRGDAEDGKGGVIGELASIGYVEVVDPRVRNVYMTDEEIPGTDATLTTDSTEHVPLKGYGKTGIQVTVNGETFYTFFNSAPLLYNTKTTRCLDAGYHWYRSQWDQRAGTNHSCGAGDCASKSATWGVFEDLATGERYIAISTHMCTRNDYIRGLQAEELMEIVDQLVAKYDCPILLGGDYNGNYTSKNYKCFVNHGFVDYERGNLATVYVSKERAHHTYPAIDHDRGISMPQENDNTGQYKSSSSVDHILIGNAEEGEISATVYGTIIDEVSIASSDHFPVFLDFSIHSPTT